MGSFRLPVILVVAALTMIGCSRKPAQEPMIGHVAPLGGPEKIIGDHARQAILLAVEDIKKEETGASGRPLAVLHPRGDPQQLQALAVRLIKVDGVVALLVSSSAAEAEALGRAAQSYEVPVVTSAELPPQTEGENVFSVNMGLAHQGRILARFAVHELKADRVATLVDSGRTESAALAAAFAKEFSKQAGAPAQESVYQTEAHLSDAIGRVTKEPFQAVFHAGSIGDLKQVNERLRAAGITVPLLFGGDGTHLTALLADRDTGQDAYLATVFVDECDTTANREFVNKYRERFHEAPDIHAALAYDGVQILFQALRRAKDVQPAKLRAALANSVDNPFQSLTGPLVFNKDRSACRTVFIVRVADGRLKPVKQYNPTEAD